MSERSDARLLLSILRGDLAAPGTPPAGARFGDLCRACDVAPTVHAILERAGRFDLVGADAERELARARHKCRNDNLLLLARLEQALDILGAEGIVPIALKGISFLGRFYPSFDARTLDDADLLVAPAEAARAIEALERAGWTGPRGAERTHWLRSSFEMPLTSPGPVTVLLEIHWSLGQEQRYDIPVGEILARTVPQEIAGRPARRLDDHDAAAHLLLHHVQHYFDRRLKWAVDLASIVADPGFDWSEVARRLRSWKGSGAASLALRHLRKVHPPASPDEARRVLPVAAWRRAILLPFRSPDPVDFFRGTRWRIVQLLLAAAALESPADLPGYLRHRARRDRD
ncbi:MAG TPA: nucleotidyltransferase family protein [Candidatus Polarisedimenticolaceae bacterium]